LPDKSVREEYYAVIPSPIAFENVTVNHLLNHVFDDAHILTIALKTGKNP
jgi:hypothetical protein